MDCKQLLVTWVISDITGQISLHKRREAATVITLALSHHVTEIVNKLNGCKTA